MPPRIQKTPHGDVTLTSRWMRDHYMLVSSGSVSAISWLFPKAETPQIRGNTARHAFEPAPRKVTVERELRLICSRWQDHWNERLQDALDDAGEPTAQPLRPALTTLGALFDHLHQERRASVAKSTTDRDRYRLQVWRDALGNDLPLIVLTPERIALGLNAIGARTSPSTANTALGVLKTYLTWAGNMGLLKDFSHRTVRRLREPAAQRHQRDWWTAPAVDLALFCAASDPHQPTATLLVACGCYLGLRPEEIIMLRWQDLNLDAVDPKTGEPKPVCHVTPHDGWQPKDGEARDIPICTPLLTILKKHRRSEGYLLERQPNRRGRPRGGKGWIYRYDPKWTWDRLMKAVQAAGGKRITMYGMRHSFTSNLLIAGVSDVKVGRWLGYADTRMVRRHYGHLLRYDDDINAVHRPRQ